MKWKGQDAWVWKKGKKNNSELENCGMSLYSVSYALLSLNKHTAQVRDEVKKFKNGVSLNRLWFQRAHPTSENGKSMTHLHSFGHSPRLTTFTIGEHSYEKRPKGSWKLEELHRSKSKLEWSANRTMNIFFYSTNVALTIMQKLNSHCSKTQ